MSRRQRNRRRVLGTRLLESIAEHPPQQRSQAEIERLAQILDAVPVGAGQLERSGAK